MKIQTKKYWKAKKKKKMKHSKRNEEIFKWVKLQQKDTQNANIKIICFVFHLTS